MPAAAPGAGEGDLELPVAALAAVAMGATEGSYVILQYLTAAVSAEGVRLASPPAAGVKVAVMVQLSPTARCPREGEKVSTPGALKGGIS